MIRVILKQLIILISILKLKNTLVGLFCLLTNSKIEAKIIHKGRGKFKILEDKYKGKYVNKIVDASDVIRCIVNSDDDKTYNIASKEKLAQFSNKKQYIDLET